MKTMTMKDIIELEKVMRAKLDRIGALERMITKIRASYKTMTNRELDEAIREVVDIRKEIETEKKWCDNAQKEIGKFFTPAA